MSDIMSKILEKSLELSKYSDPHNYDRNLERALWVMEVVDKEFGVEWLNPNQIARILTEKIGISASQDRKEGNGTPFERWL